MATLKERIIDLLTKNGGLSDREITDILMGKKAPQQPINIMCRKLEEQGIISRTKLDGWIKNYLTDNIP